MGRRKWIEISSNDKLPLILKTVKELEKKKYPQFPLVGVLCRKRCQSPVILYYMKYDYYFNKYLAEFIILSDEHENIVDWVHALFDEGYIYNDYAKETLSIFGGLKVRGRGMLSQNVIEIYFNPVYYASGEYDRMSIYNNAADDILFPVGGLYDYTVFIGEKGKYYIADWKNLYECGESTDSFLENIFSDTPNLLELYNNE